MDIYEFFEILLKLNLNASYFIINLKKDRMPSNYTIAVLGFGSLPNHLTSEVYGHILEVIRPAGITFDPTKYNLNPKSPFVPAERLKLPLLLGRVSSKDTDKRRITLVLQHGARLKPVFYAVSKFKKLSEAIDNLKKREGCHQNDIGFIVVGFDNRDNCSISGLADKIKKWARDNGFHAVVWCHLPANIPRLKESSFEQEILSLLKGDSVLLTNTKKYIRGLATKPTSLQNKILSMGDNRGLNSSRPDESGRMKAATCRRTPETRSCGRGSRRFRGG